jgi:hypothetical protein
MKTKMKYKYNEDKLLTEFMNYIDTTYNQHYSSDNGVQSMDLISATGKGLDFCLGNVIKYGARYGKKAGYNRADIIKIMHYSLLALNEHDLNMIKGDNSETK